VGHRVHPNPRRKMALNEVGLSAHLFYARDEHGNTDVEPAADASIKALKSGCTCDLFPLLL